MIKLITTVISRLATEVHDSPTAKSCEVFPMRDEHACCSIKVVEQRTCAIAVPSENGEETVAFNFISQLTV
jgi:hypothetical protein